jgi:hypothetical protein
MEKTQIVLEFESIDDLKGEFERNLSNGGAFVRNAPNAKKGDDCDVVLIHPVNGQKKAIASMVTLVVDQGENKGLGIAFDNFNAVAREAILKFITDNDEPPQEESRAVLRDKSPYMSETHRFNVAREGDAGERIELERKYGKLVWEMLLRSPKITRMEVARIAKKGALPKNLRQLILSNPGWLSDSQVRSGLLTNPRMSDAEVATVLRASPKHELRLLAKQTSIPHRIRKVALNIISGL